VAFRLGFAEHRRQLLQQELERIADELPTLGILKAIVTGDLATGQVGPESNLELLIVQETEAPFAARIDFFFNHLKPRIGLNVLVYTPEEFAIMEQTSPFLRSSLRQGAVIYEA
jgi:predicted nucleotidyltransferase